MGTDSTASPPGHGAENDDVSSDLSEVIQNAAVAPASIKSSVVALFSGMSPVLKGFTALLTAATALLAALTAAGLLGGDDTLPSPATPALTPAIVATVPSGGASANGSATVRIDGPLTAPLEERTVFAITTTNAARLEWTAAGMNTDIFVVNDPAPVHNVWVEPTEAQAVGLPQQIFVTVFDPDGRPVTASHAYTVID